MKPMKISDIFIQDENDIVIAVDRFKTSFQKIVNKTFGNKTGASLQISFTKLCINKLYFRKYTLICRMHFFKWTEYLTYAEKP